MDVSARRLTRATAAVSGAFSVALFWAAFRFNSNLALAQASDSLLDVTGAVVLAWVVAVAQEPRDARHPMGHSRAEPLGALGIALLAGILALEVGSAAVQSIMGGTRVEPSPILVTFFVAKVVFKAVVWVLSSGKKTPAFSALLVDARNDCLVGVLAVLGFIGARFGNPAVDAWIACPAAFWIGWSGFSLAKENIDLLMGVAPDPARQAQLLAIATGSDGVLQAHDLVAHHLGTHLSIHVHIVVDGGLSVRQAHDIGEGVRERLMREVDVGHCSVHIDPSED